MAFPVVEVEMLLENDDTVCTLPVEVDDLFEDNVAIVDAFLLVDIDLTEDLVVVDTFFEEDVEGFAFFAVELVDLEAGPVVIKVFAFADDVFRVDEVDFTLVLDDMDVVRAEDEERMDDFVLPFAVEVDFMAVAAVCLELVFVFEVEDVRETPAAEDDLLLALPVTEKRNFDML
ncbi:hypothetical protein HDU67_002660 [Dinochytrium kinnereticum]|nr:hypothetical protein HDU67_002660 [Dinochytrium kinnereticum]